MQEPLSQRDKQVFWHPCTQMKDHETRPIIPIKSGRGVYLEDYNGNKYIDAISSWWVNIFGHCNPQINAAIKKQLDTLEHVIMAGFSHEPAITLAEKLVKITPAGLEKCFFADNGSTAVEASLKMSYHYWQNTGNTRKYKFIHLSNGYHGETLGAMSVSDVAIFKKTYKKILHENITVQSPDCYHKAQGQSDEEHSAQAFQHMQEALEKHHDEVCAVIVEPLVQCAGGMRMYHPVYLKLLREACDKYNVHLIADEIAVGFGRTGKMFACEHAEITPDFLCLSKALTGGYLPLSTVVTTDDIYQGFYHDYTDLKAFLQSHSYTGNALACSAANATLDIFANENIISKNQTKINYINKCLEKFQSHPNISDARQTGMMAAIEIVEDKKTKTPYDFSKRINLPIYDYALQNGVLLRPIGNVVYFVPQYVITEEEIDKITDVALAGINYAIGQM